jgi:hypothetical protein
MRKIQAPAPLIKKNAQRKIVNSITAKKTV